MPVGGLFVCGLDDGAREGPVPVDVGVVDGVRITGSVGISHCAFPVALWTKYHLRSTPSHWASLKRTNVLYQHQNRQLEPWNARSRITGENTEKAERLTNHLATAVVGTTALRCRGGRLSPSTAIRQGQKRRSSHPANFCVFS